MTDHELDNAELAGTGLKWVTETPDEKLEPCPCCGGSGHKDDAAQTIREAEVVARPLEEWHEDFGDVVWWVFPIREPAWIGTPNDDSWPNYHTHWTPHPAIPTIAAKEKDT